MTRRELLLGSTAATLFGQNRSPIIEPHVHLFDPARFPYAPNAPYKPAPYTVEDHAKLAAAVSYAHAIIVHPEPYQDDHRLLEYAFAHEPRPGYFKGTCLFDPLRDDTPARVRALVEKWPKRIIGMRIHAMAKTPEASGPIRNRDLRDPKMAACWKALNRMGLAVQMHFIPAQAPNIRALAEQFPDMTVILDHLGRPASGTAAEYDEVLKLAKLPKVILKFSSWGDYKGDLAALSHRIYDTFGPDRIIWGTFGNTSEEYGRNLSRLLELFQFAPLAARDSMDGGNVQRLFFS